MNNMNEKIKNISEIVDENFKNMNDQYLNIKKLNDEHHKKIKQMNIEHYNKIVKMNNEHNCQISQLTDKIYEQNYNDAILKMDQLIRILNNFSQKSVIIDWKLFSDIVNAISYGVSQGVISKDLYDEIIKVGNKNNA